MSQTGVTTSAEQRTRFLTGKDKALLVLVCLAWSLFQLWYSSPLPFVYDLLIFNDTEARSIHLAFALFLGFMLYPRRKKSSRHAIPLTDWVAAGAGALAAGYLVISYQELADRAGAPSTLDILVGVGGLLLLLEAARRSLGPPLMVVAALFLLYTFAGPYMPEVIAHKGASVQKTIAHQWLGTEGVFGVALGVSTSFVFLYVLFGALLERAGAGKFFIELSFSLLGHMRGGPAKAAVVASGLSGAISGSSIANVVTTGTFTIPLMKKVGFPPAKAGAVEVAASTNGQLTPPIMGAAAFLMVEYVGISYLEVVKHALLPAVISYIALLYIVHLEAVKAGMQGLARPRRMGLAARLAATVGVFLILCLVTMLLYPVFSSMQLLFGEYTNAAGALLMLVMYVVLVGWSAGVATVEDALDENPNRIPALAETLRSGLYYLLPVIVLLWCLVVERLSPGLSAFWATIFLLVIVYTQHPLRALFRRESPLPALRRGIEDVLAGLVNGARNMIGIGVATAAAGIIVGTVTLTGIGLVMTELVELISAGNLLLMLLFTALISLILGLGLPTTANYIVVSTLMAPVVVTLGAQHGLVVPLIAVHLFVFYFGILADDTPPVGLAAFAASAIAQADPVRTGLQGFAYDIRTAILPFMFIFNTELLLIGVESWLHLLVTVLSAIVAMLCFAAATQRYWLTRNRWWETMLLLLVAFSLFRPGYWWDRIYPPQEQLAASEVFEVAENLPETDPLKLWVQGNNLAGEWISKTILLPLAAGQTGLERLQNSGLYLRRDESELIVDSVVYGSAAYDAGLDLDWQVNAVMRDAQRPPKQWMVVPAFMVLSVIALLQTRRLSRQAA